MNRWIARWENEGGQSAVLVRFSEARREVLESSPDIFVQSRLLRRIEQERGPQINLGFFESVVRVEPAADGVDPRRVSAVRKRTGERWMFSARMCTCEARPEDVERVQTSLGIAVRKGGNKPG
jgi:hypothetical protein